MNKNFIVITSINNPTQGVIKYSKIPNHKLIVVGDLKTPTSWKLPNVKFIDVKSQEEYGKISKLIPYNHYARKNIGYLEALRSGAKVIIDTDDDNVPKKNWNYPKNFHSINNITSEKKYINIYNYFSKERVWPRGLPIEFINEDIKYKIISTNKKKIGIWQGLADKEPDVDAIFRITNKKNKKIIFNNKRPVGVSKNIFTQINSQNTIFNENYFPLLYLPSTVSFRFTDILRGYVAQPILWSDNVLLGFFGPSVYQNRNIHSNKLDFISEIEMYKNLNDIEHELLKLTFKGKNVFDKLITSYELLVEKKICDKSELKILEAWIKQSLLFKKKN